MCFLQEELQLVGASCKAPIKPNAQYRFYQDELACSAPGLNSGFFAVAVSLLAAKFMYY